MVEPVRAWRGRARGGEPTRRAWILGRTIGVVGHDARGFLGTSDPSSGLVALTRKAVPPTNGRSATRSGRGSPSSCSLATGRASDRRPDPSSADLRLDPVRA